MRMADPLRNRMDREVRAAPIGSAVAKLARPQMSRRNRLVPPQIWLPRVPMAAPASQNTYQKPTPVSARIRPWRLTGECR